jgi:hypothetical protein
MMDFISSIQQWLNWFLPADMPSGLDYQRAILMVVTCLIMLIAMWLLVLTWKISGDLQKETVAIALFLTVVMGGILTAVKNGAFLWSAIILLSLLFLLVTLDLLFFGAGSPALTAYTLPILLAAYVIGLWAALLMAVLISAMLWLTAYVALTQRYEPQLPAQRSHLTFTAPTLSLIFLSVALLSGLWTIQLGAS